MKRFQWVLIAVGFLAFNPLQAQKIETDYLEALELAKTEDKALLYVFVDEQSSKDFKNNFLKSSELKSVQSSFIILEVNCSGNLDPQAVELMYCRRLTMVHNENKIFPSVLATNKSFQPVGELQTDFSKDVMASYFNYLKSL